MVAASTFTLAAWTATRDACVGECRGPIAGCPATTQRLRQHAGHSAFVRVNAPGGADVSVCPGWTATASPSHPEAFEAWSRAESPVVLTLGFVGSSTGDPEDVGEPPLIVEVIGVELSVYALLRGW